MPTPREIREANADSNLLALLSDEVRAKVEDGTYYAVAGKRPDRPWVRRSDNNRVVQGQSPRSPDSAEQGRRTALKQTASYRDALELFLPMFSDGEQRQSFERLVEKVLWAVEGAPQKVTFDCPHPETCPQKNKKHVVAYTDKPDPVTGFKLIELLAGKAAQTINQNTKVTADVSVMEHRTLDVRVYDMSTQTAEQRKQQLIEAGVIEHEWLEIAADLASPNVSPD